MDKYIENVVKFLIEKFPKNVNYHYYGKSGIYTIEHTIPDLYENNEFTDIVDKNLYDNDIYNVYFKNITGMTAEEVENSRFMET